MSPIFSRKPKLKRCFFCSELYEPPAENEHFRTHLIAVTDNNGLRAYTFKCPRCGPMDLSWGGGTPDDTAQWKGAAAMTVHLMQKHSIPL